MNPISVEYIIAMTHIPIHVYEYYRTTDNECFDINPAISIRSWLIGNAFDQSYIFLPDELQDRFEQCIQISNDKELLVEFFIECAKVISQHGTSPHVTSHVQLINIVLDHMDELPLENEFSVEMSIFRQNLFIVSEYFK